MSMANLASRLRPLGNRILIRKAVAQTTTASGKQRDSDVSFVEREFRKTHTPRFRSPTGIILPDTAQSKIPQGTVLAVGPGELNMEGNRVPVNIKVDAEVFLPEYGGTKVPVEGDEELFLYREDEILAVIE